MKRGLEFAPVAAMVCAPAWVLIVVAWCTLTTGGALTTTFVLSPWFLVPAWIALVEWRGRGRD